MLPFSFRSDEDVAPYNGVSVVKPNSPINCNFQPLISFCPQYNTPPAQSLSLRAGVETFIKKEKPPEGGFP